MALADNPEALAAIITGLGGTVIPGRTFRFDLPLSQVREAVPKINQATGLRVEKVSERQDTGDPSGPDRVQGIATLELRRQPQEPTDYDSERNLMRAIVR
jgi:hypothetical protein